MEPLCIKVPSCPAVLPVAKREVGFVDRQMCIIESAKFSIDFHQGRGFEVFMSNHPKVVSIFYFQPPLQDMLREAAGGEIVFVRNAKELIPALKDTEVACLGELPEAWQEVAPQLRWVQCPGAGVDGLRKSSAFRPDSGIVFTNASGVHMA